MDNFSVSNWFKKRSDLNIQLFSVDGVEFELMALSDEQKEAVLECETYDMALTRAANYGVSYDRKRVSDDAELAKDLDLLWELEEVNAVTDPCMQFRIGERVCEISGINADIDSMLAEEKAEEEKAEEERKLQAEMDENAINGDSLEGDSVTTMGELQQHADDYNSAVQ